MNNTHSFSFIYNYSFGFNGQEKDDEVYGATGTSYTAEFWQYDARIGRRWNVDPVVKHDQSGYSAFANSPIWIMDHGGDDSLIVHRSTGEKVGNAMHYVITFSVVQQGVETVLPFLFHQATNANYVQAPRNSDVKMSFQRMASGGGSPDYKNTIRVWVPKKSGGYFQTFMHPTYYKVSPYLKGCMATYTNLNDDGSPKVALITNTHKRYWKNYKQQETGNVLDFINKLYTDFNIGDSKGDFSGNDFFMRTDSRVTESIPKMAPKRISRIETSLGESQEL